MPQATPKKAKSRRLKSGSSLRGVRILVSRARRQAGKLSSALRAEGASVLEIPFIEIRKPRSFRPLDAALDRIDGYDWLILTSVNGVGALFERMARLKIRKQALAKLKIAAIGPATRSSVEEKGLTVTVMPREYVAEAVVASLAKRVKGKRVLLVRAKVARDVIPRELQKAGAHVDVVEAYETVVPERSRQRLTSALSDSRRAPHVITFTSSSTVRNFVELAGKRAARRALSRGVQAASIGPVTSGTLREFGLPAHIQAKEYTIPGLVKAIVKAKSVQARD